VPGEFEGEDWCEPVREGIVAFQSRYLMAGIIVASVCASMCKSARGQNPPTQQPPTQQSGQQDQQTQQTQQVQPPQQTQATQQPLSVADAARKYREEKAAKEKTAAPPTRVYTNEGVLPKPGANALGITPIPIPTQSAGSRAGRGGAAPGPETSQADAQASMEKAEEKLDKALEVINAVAAVDRATLVNAILKDNNIDFPERKQWEDRLMAGRDYYVMHGRQVIFGMKQLLVEARQLSETDPNMREDDPKLQSFMRRSKDGYNDAQKTAADFQHLMEEGQALAKQALERRR
jgi:hypothetical protein